MSFWDEIYELRKQGSIPKVWTRRDLLPYMQGQYAENTIGTVPSNQSIARDGTQPGNYIKRGQEPKAWRVSRGEFQLVIDPDDDKATQDAERQLADSYCSTR